MTGTIYSKNRLRSKASGKKSNILSAKLDRKRRRKVLEGYPISPFNMSKEDQKSYFSGDSITCLLCGKKYRSLGGNHLRRIHEITEDQYREMYGIPYNKGLICGELNELRVKQAIDRELADKYLKQYKECNRKKARVSAAARSARKENIKVAKKAYLDIDDKLLGPRKLTEEQVLQILKDDRTNTEIAKEYGMSVAWVCGLRAGKILTQYGGSCVEYKKDNKIKYRDSLGRIKKKP